MRLCALPGAYFSFFDLICQRWPRDAAAGCAVFFTLVLIVILTQRKRPLYQVWQDLKIGEMTMPTKAGLIKRAAGRLSSGESKTAGNWLAILLISLVPLVLLCREAPPGLERQGYAVIVVMVYMLLLWIFQPVQYTVASIWGLLLLVFLKVGHIPDLASGFASESIFFLAAVLLLGYAVHKTGLDHNVALAMVGLFRNNPSRIAAATPFIVLLMGLLVPSAIARAIILRPIYREICANNLALPANREKFNRATFLAIGPLSPAASATYLSGSAAPLLAAEILHRYTGYEITWTMWLLLVGVPFLLLFFMTSFYVSIRFPIHEGKGPSECVQPAVQFKPEEKVLLAIIGIMVFFWLIGGSIGLRAVVTALAGVLLLFLPGIAILDIRDIHGINWELLLFNGIIISFSHLLITTGAAAWLSELIFQVIQPLVPTPWLLLTAIALILMILRFFFFNNVPYLTFVLPIILSISGMVNLNPVALSFIAVFISSIVFIPMQSMTSLIAMGEENRRGDIASFGLVVTGCFIVIIPLAYLFLWPAAGLQ